MVDLSIQGIEEIFDLREALENLVVKNAVLDAKVLEHMRAAVESAKKFREQRLL